MNFFYSIFFKACNIITCSFILNNSATTVLSQITLQELVLKIKYAILAPSAKTGKKVTDISQEMVNHQKQLLS